MLFITGFALPQESALIYFLVSEPQNAPGCVPLGCEIECDKHHKMGRKLLRSRDNSSPSQLVGEERGGLEEESLFLVCQT